MLLKSKDTDVFLDAKRVYIKGRKEKEQKTFNKFYNSFLENIQNSKS